MLRHFLLGTAGHVDHGKTSLIKTLTGTDTDRLPEEKRRGLTVDLGFAALECEGMLLGIVDVPGHERFIKNMLAGATGIDLALLVVAADEGVMPQTREHFGVLKYLGIDAGVIAITKCDLVDEEMAELVKEDVGELVAGSFLAGAPVVEVSAKTGEGLEHLRSQLAIEADKLPAPDLGGPFRLSVDRCFSLPGMGTIVTGSVANGQVSCGETLQVLPEGKLVTVRNIESHGASLPSVGRGQRAALNLTGVHYTEIERGYMLATVGSLVASRRLTVQFELRQSYDRPLKPRNRIRFYSGTSETIGILRTLETKLPMPGESVICQIELQDSICATWAEPYVVRGLADNEVLGGGRVVDPCAFRLAVKNSESVAQTRRLLEGEPAERVAAFAALAGTRLWLVDSLPQRAGVAEGQAICTALEEAGVLCRFELKSGARWLHHKTVAKLEARLLEAIQCEHERQPARPVVPLNQVAAHFDSLEPAELLSHLVQDLCNSGQVGFDNSKVALTDWCPQLSSLQTAHLAEIESRCERAGLTPPSVAELANELQLPLEAVEMLLEVAVDNCTLVRLPDKETRDANAARRARLYLHKTAEVAFLAGLESQLAGCPEWTVSQFGEVIGLSRKYSIPLCLYLDNNGITTRSGDARRLIGPDSGGK